MVTEEDRYSLDTSAIMAYFTDEPGADRVEHVLELADTGRAEVYASFMMFMEVLYRTWRRLGENPAKATYLRLKALSLRRVDISEDLIIAAARAKATYDLSVADAWIAATARLTRSSLVHKDPEFRPLAKELRVVELPLKAARHGGTRRRVALRAGAERREGGPR